MTRPEDHEVPDNTAGVAQLMERYMDGDPGAFRALEAVLGPRLRRMMRRFTHDDASLDDVIQMTFLKAHLARDRFVPSRTDPDGSVRAWYYTIARRSALDLARKQTRQKARTTDLEGAGGIEGSVPDLAQNIEASLTQEEQAQEIITRVRAAVDALPAGQREVVQMHKLQGMTMAEVAERLAIQEGTARVRAHRAYKSLTRLLTGAGQALLWFAAANGMWGAATNVGGAP